MKKIEPKKLDPDEQEHLHISAYWPKKTDDELHVGYGITKNHIVLESASIVIALSGRLFNLFIEPKYRTKSLWLRGFPFMFLGILLSILIGVQRKRKGFYQLNEDGIPTFFIGTFPPESTLGRRGVSYQKFLQALK